MQSLNPTWKKPYVVTHTKHMHNLLYYFFHYSMDVRLVSKVTYMDHPKPCSPVLSYPNRVKPSGVAPGVWILGHPSGLEETIPCWGPAPVQCLLSPANRVVLAADCSPSGWATCPPLQGPIISSSPAHLKSTLPWEACQPLPIKSSCNKPFNWKTGMI